jgi:hypothetical protein
MWWWVGIGFVLSLLFAMAMGRAAKVGDKMMGVEDDE